MTDRDGRDGLNGSDGPEESNGDVEADTNVDTDADADAGSNADADVHADANADRFVVGIHVTESELTFIVHVPSNIDSGWRDPTEFQRLVERVTWDRLDQESTLRSIARGASPGETVTLGTVTLQPDGTVVSHSLSSPAENEGDAQ